MTTQDLQLVQAKDAVATSELLADSDFELMLDNQKVIVREIEKGSFHVLLEAHTLTRVEKLRDKILTIERNLLDIRDALGQKLTEAKKASDESIVGKTNLIANCNDLIAQNERTKKNVMDALASRRYYEPRIFNTPMQIAGTMIGSPISAAGLMKIFFSSKQEVLIPTAIAGAVLGAIVSFPYQAQAGWNSAKNSVCDNGKQIKNSFMLYYLKETGRQKILSTAFFFRFRSNVVTVNIHRRPQRSPLENRVVEVLGVRS